MWHISACILRPIELLNGVRVSTIILNERIAYILYIYDSDVTGYDLQEFTVHTIQYAIRCVIYYFRDCNISLTV